MSIPKISVIMAVYNGENYLRYAIDSVLQQSYIDYELIIVDDCSTDATAEIISSYNDSRIKYIKNKVNLGQTPSLNIGLKSSRAKYIARIDADDIYHPEKLENQYCFMEKNPEIAVCGTSGERIDEFGNQSGFRLYPQKFLDIYFRLFYHSPLNHVSVIMRRSIIVDQGGYDENYPFCADFALWSKLVKIGYKITNLQSCLVKYRIFSGSLGAYHKFGQSGDESARIIYTNITELLGLPISRKECRDIVFMLWPSSEIDLFRILNAYLNLTLISRVVYKNKVPAYTVLDLSKHLFKSLIKKNLYLKSQKQFGLKPEELSNIIRDYYRIPSVIVMVIVSYFVVFALSEKIIHRLGLNKKL